MNLTELQSVVRGELDELEEQLRASLVSRLPLIQTVADHLLLTRGKRFRPTLLLLIAKLNGSPRSEAICAATVVELIHTATLIHDDSIDKSELRRGLPTVNFKWDDDVSIAMGDFLYSKAFYMLVNNEMYEAMSVLADATHRMSAGEMLEIERRNDLDITEDDYLKMISEKTASLMAACCEIGVLVGDSQDGARGRFSRYGQAVGLAFQITDDLFDFVGQKKQLGKEIGSDARSGKFTLPVIATLRNATSKDKARMHSILTSGALMDGKWQELLSLIDEYDGIKYSRQRAFAYAAEAKESIKPFESSPCYLSLCSAVDYTVERKR
jgi:octaprenyl-diphosphate synthase